MDSHSEAAIFIGLLLVLLAASLQQMLPPPPSSTVGIDLGTTFSAVAVFDDGEITVIPSAYGSTILPSVVFVPDNGSEPILTGDRARPAAAASPGTLVYDAKRLIGKAYDPARTPDEARGLPFDVVAAAPREWDGLPPPPKSAPPSPRPSAEARLQVWAGGQRVLLAPEEVGALVIRELKGAAEAHVGRPVTQAVLAVPVGFGASQIAATRRAAHLSGLEVLRMIHEPTAAAMAYGLHNQAHALTVMVYDLGGGTLDVSLLNLNNGIFEVMAAAGDNRLGGQDFSAALLERILSDVAERMPGTDIRGDAEVMRELREEAERIKARRIPVRAVALASTLTLLATPTLPITLALAHHVPSFTCRLT